MKIAILSDAHLFHKNSQSQLYKKLILDLQEKVDMIVDCGDLIDKNIINATQAEELKNIFKNIHIPFHIVKGNHDALGGVSLTTLLAMNNNIVVHNDIDFIQYKNRKLLFIPYLSTAKEIYSALKNLDMQTSADYAFSHLNVTSNFYASISFDMLVNLYAYASTFFNGHIHTPEKNISAFGNFYNVGSLSSLTYGDEHIPCYSILDTETDSIETKFIGNSIIHRTIKISEDVENVYNIINNISQDSINCKMKINWRLQIPNNYDIDTKQKIKQYIQSLVNTNNIQFSYIQQNNKQQNIHNTLNIKNGVKLPMLQQLLQAYEKDNNTFISSDVKTKLEV